MCQSWSLLSNKLYDNDILFTDCDDDYNEMEYIKWAVVYYDDVCT